MHKPKVFIGSSEEGWDIAKALELHLSRHCETTVWDSGVFKLSKSALENLEGTLDKHEFGVLVLTPDDLVESRKVKSKAPRDNVVFELGLFVGRLGKERTFVACDKKKLKLPSDLFGMQVARFDWQRASKPQEVFAAVSPASTEILMAIRSAPSAIPKPRVARGDITGRDELYLAITGRSSSLSAVIILHDETNWAWKLFPTILDWSLSGVPVTVFLSPPHGDDKQLRQERYRRNLLKNLGARVITHRSLPIKGFFLDAQDEGNLEALVLTEDSTEYRPLASRYDANDQLEAARALLNAVPPSWKQTRAEFRPSIRKYPDKDVAEILRRNVFQYKARGVSVKPEFVDTGSLNVISRYTRGYKYQQMRYLAERYRKARVTPFKALSISLRDGSRSVVTPPVVEETPDGLVVMEGNTRATCALHNEEEEFFCLLVRGVSETPLGVPYALSEVKVTERTLAPEERVENFDYHNFRHIERAVHPY